MPASVSAFFDRSAISFCLAFSAASAAALKKIADAADPLYKTLDEGQKRRLAILTHHGRFGGEGGGWRHRWMERGMGHDRDHDGDSDHDGGGERL